MKHHHRYEPPRDKGNKPGWEIACIALLACVLCVATLIALALARLVALAMVAAQVAVS